MHTVFIIVTLIIYAAANTVRNGALSKNTKMDPLQFDEISNRVRRNASEIPNISEIPDSHANTKNNLIQDILSHIPHQDLINSLLTGRTKRSYFDYDPIEYEEKIDPKTQLGQISSRNFASNAYNDEQRRKLFFSQLFSMIDGSTNSAKPKIDLENNDPLRSNKSFNKDIVELYSERSQNQKTDEHGKSSDIRTEANVYVPVRKMKKRRQVLNSSSIPDNLKHTKKVRHERHLGELINDNADAPFYKFNKFAPRTNEDYESVENAMEQQLSYGPPEDDVIETSSVYFVPTTTETSIENESIEQDNYKTNITDASPSTLDSQNSMSYITPDNINVTEQDEWISTKYTLYPFKYTRRPASQQEEKVYSHKINVTEPLSSTKNTYSLNIEKSNEVIDEEENDPTSTESNNVIESNVISSPAEVTSEQNQSPYTYAPVENVIEFDKIQSRRTDNTIENNKVNPEKVENVSEIEQEADQTQDVEFSSIYGEADSRLSPGNVLANPLSARIKLDFAIQLQGLGNDGF